MHEIGPCPDCQLTRCVDFGFSVTSSSPTAPFFCVPSPWDVSASSSPSGLATSPNLAVDLGQTYSSVPRKEWLKSIGLYCWPVFFPCSPGLTRGGCSSRGTGPGHSCGKPPRDSIAQTGYIESIV